MELTLYYTYNNTNNKELIDLGKVLTPIKGVLEVYFQTYASDGSAAGKIKEIFDINHKDNTPYTNIYAWPGAVALKKITSNTPYTIYRGEIRTEEDAPIDLLEPGTVAAGQQSKILHLFADANAQVVSIKFSDIDFCSKFIHTGECNQFNINYYNKSEITRLVAATQAVNPVPVNNDVIVLNSTMVGNYIYIGNKKDMDTVQVLCYNINYQATKRVLFNIDFINDLSTLTVDNKPDENAIEIVRDNSTGDFYIHILIGTNYVVMSNNIATALVKTELTNTTAVPIRYSRGGHTEMINYPNYITFYGTRFANVSNKREYYFFDGGFYDSQGNKYGVVSAGPTSSRPAFSDIVVGYPYYDTDINMMIFNSGTKWVDGMGNSPDILKSGSSTQRPTSLNSTNVGFQYFDTTLVKPIYWTGTSWVDSTGTAI